MQDALVREISRLADDLPTELMEQIANALDDQEVRNWSSFRSHVLNSIANTNIRPKLERFLDIWERDIPGLNPAAVAFALRTAAETADYYRKQQQLELVWTGPETEHVLLRRTDQALLQLINEARQSLHIVSFAVYKIDRIKNALLVALERGVEISLYLETSAESEGRMSIDTVQVIGQELTDLTSIYVWPREKRKTTEEGRIGSLHAKIALADKRLMLLSSANLTEYAMTLNMEMGVLIWGGPLPEQVAAHLASLIRAGIFKRLE